MLEQGIESGSSVCGGLGDCSSRPTAWTQLTRYQAIIVPFSYIYFYVEVVREYLKSKSYFQHIRVKATEYDIAGSRIEGKRIVKGDTNLHFTS